MNTNINFLFEEGKRKRLILSTFFIGFPIGGLGKPNIYQNLGGFTRIGDFTWRVSDCEELSGGGQSHN